MHTYIHIYIHTYIHIYIHTYIHTYIHIYIRIRIRIFPISADNSELVSRDYLCPKQLSTPHQLARLMKEATADRDLALHHTDTVAFSMATKLYGRSIPQLAPGTHSQLGGLRQ